MGSATCFRKSQSLSLGQESYFDQHDWDSLKIDVKKDTMPDDPLVYQEDLIKTPFFTEKLKLFDEYYKEEEPPTQSQLDLQLSSKIIDPAETYIPKKNQSNRATIIITELDEFSQVKNQSAFLIDNSPTSKSQRVISTYRAQSQKLFLSSLKSLKDASSIQKLLDKRSQLTPKSVQMKSYSIRNTFMDIYNKRKQLQRKS